MKFWKQLRLLGLVIVFAIAAVTVVLDVLNRPDGGNGSSDRPHPAPNTHRNITGL